ncbi:hypothetical protein SAMN05421788_104251 [Filimonas lacunae]|uniref:Uncharacterized protein n=1 Tax=Filimonas lacunae TaxID=477680 RepID=A0A173MSF8_9BACT|nr:hypothetical protein [Filimonas lacunae]BAV10378.1 hypothetical protein FLA_6440 [Filimonas lacunae]SIT16465.1 hypothetical protein SAMN05421788_104251 [Filimonas lacunae]
MTLFTCLSAAAILFFAAHVILLFTSFPKGGFYKTRYLWSHITLWLVGVILFAMTAIYSGSGISSLADIFDTMGKRLLILVVTFAVSGLAHMIVRFLVLGNKTARG